MKQSEPVGKYDSSVVVWGLLLRYRRFFFFVSYRCLATAVYVSIFLEIISLHQTKEANATI
jgi:hypothetical protein